MFLALAVLAASFLGLSALVWHTRTAVGFDRTLAGLPAAASVGEFLAPAEPSASGVTPVVNLGSFDVVVALAAVLAMVAVAWRDPVGGLLALGGPGLTGALTQYLLKPLITPPSLGGGRAFPSGHAGGAAAVALVAVVLVYRRWGRLPALLLAPLAVIMVAAVSSALVRLGLHFPTDVVGGVVLAALVVLGGAAALSLLGWPGPAGRPRPGRRRAMNLLSHPVQSVR